MKTGILTFEQFQGKKDIGSSRIRGHWIVQHWKEAGLDIGECELFKYGEKYDAVIFQKAYFVEYAKKFNGVKIFDICDPDWLHWSFRFKEMIEACDAVTCSSKELCTSISKFTKKPVYFVPDRVDLSLVPPPKIHVGPTRNAVWYGYSHNFAILDSTIPALAKHGLGLIVVSDDVYMPSQQNKVEVTNLPWSPFYMRDIQKGDVVINPRHEKGKWKYKSDNKTSLAWALGMPVAHNGEQLDALMTEEARVKQSTEKLALIKAEYDILHSVTDYKDIITEIAKSKGLMVESTHEQVQAEKVGAA